MNRFVPHLTPVVIIFFLVASMTWADLGQYSKLEKANGFIYGLFERYQGQIKEFKVSPPTTNGDSQTSYVEIVFQMCEPEKVPSLLKELGTFKDPGLTFRTDSLEISASAESRAGDRKAIVRGTLILTLVQSLRPEHSPLRLNHSQLTGIFEKIRFEPGIDVRKKTRREGIEQWFVGLRCIGEEDAGNRMNASGYALSLEGFLAAAAALQKSGTLEILFPLTFSSCHLAGIPVWRFDMSMQERKGRTPPVPCETLLKMIDEVEKTGVVLQDARLRSPVEMEGGWNISLELGFVSITPDDVKTLQNCLNGWSSGGWKIVFPSHPAERILMLKTMNLELVTASESASIQDPPSKEDASTFCHRANEAFKAGNLETSVRLMVDSLKKEPNHAVNRYLLARVLLAKGDLIGAKENFDIVLMARPSKERGEAYNIRLRQVKRKIATLQEELDNAAEQRFQGYLKNLNSPEEIKLAATLYAAFRLNPALSRTHRVELQIAIWVYERALEDSIKGEGWRKIPMMQLAFLYELAQCNEKAEKIYFKGLDYVSDFNEEYMLTERADYLGLSGPMKFFYALREAYPEWEEPSHWDQVLAHFDAETWDRIMKASGQLGIMYTREERETAIRQVLEFFDERRKKGTLPLPEFLFRNLGKR